MALTWITLNFSGINASLQVDDIVYYTYGGTQQGGFDSQALVQNTKKLGRVVSIDEAANSIVVEYDDLIDPDGVPNSGDEIVVNPPPVGSYISFAKDKRVNTSSVVGYYAEIKFVNNSKKKIELYNVGSEVNQSSR